MPETTKSDSQTTNGPLTTTFPTSMTTNAAHDDHDDDDLIAEIILRLA